MAGLAEEEICESHIVHRSVVPLIFRSCFTVLVSVILYIILYFIIFIAFKATSTFISLILFTGILTATSTLLIYGSMEWLNNFYLVRPSEVVVKSGVLTSREIVYTIDELASVDIAQNFWGKLLNYGDLRVSRPREEDFYLLSVPDPHHIKDVLDNIAARKKPPLHFPQ